MTDVNGEPSEIALPALNRSDPTPLHEQVAGAIRRAISDGEAGPGDRIPQARDLATVLGVNRNTVLRALRLLRDEGLLEMGRGRTIRVTGRPEQSAVVARVRELLEFGRQQGYQPEELIGLIHKLS